MKETPLHRNRRAVVSVLTTAFWIIPIVGAQSVPGQSAQSQDNRSVQDRDINRGELARFDEFLNNHPEVAEQVRRDPSLLDDRQYVENHPALREYLRDHPQTRDAIRDNPNAFMHAEDRFDRREDDRDRDRERELASFNQFLDNHREIAEQLRHNPSLADNPEFEKNHPVLRDYLRDHPGVRDSLRDNPNAFMHQEDGYASRDMNRGDRDAQLAAFDRFLQNHREAAEQLNRNPLLINDAQFLKNHPELQAYVQQHPDVRRDIDENPDAFRQQEARFDQHQDNLNHDVRVMQGSRDYDHNHMASFGEFLGAHPEVSAQLSDRPELVKDRDYVQNHPELQSYLSSHPEVQQDLMSNPQEFVKSCQQFNSNNTQTVKPSGASNAAAPSAAEPSAPKPKP
jgi:hypothetical protein